MTNNLPEIDKEKLELFIKEHPNSTFEEIKKYLGRSYEDLNKLVRIHGANISSLVTRSNDEVASLVEEIEKNLKNHYYYLIYEYKRKITQPEWWKITKLITIHPFEYIANHIKNDKQYQDQGMATAQFNILFWQEITKEQYINYKDLFNND